MTRQARSPLRAALCRLLCLLLLAGAFYHVSHVPALAADGAGQHCPIPGDAAAGDTAIPGRDHAPPPAACSAQLDYGMATVLGSPLADASCRSPHAVEPSARTTGCAVAPLRHPPEPSVPA